jgi:hypothetical protein
MELGLSREHIASHSNQLEAHRIVARAGLAGERADNMDMTRFESNSNDGCPWVKRLAGGRVGAGVR